MLTHSKHLLTTIISIVRKRLTKYIYMNMGKYLKTHYPCNPPDSGHRFFGILKNSLEELRADYKVSEYDTCTTYLIIIILQPPYILFEKYN